MKTILKVLTIPLLLTVFYLCMQHPQVDITKNTRWQDYHDLKILKGVVRFQPEIDYGDGSKQSAKIIFDVTFENQGTRPIKRVDFDLVAYSSETETASDSDSRNFKIKKHTYDHVLSPNETGGMSVDLAGWDVTLPVRQTVRVVRILYEDGTIWERGKREMGRN